MFRVDKQTVLRSKRAEQGDATTIEQCRDRYVTGKERADWRSLPEMSSRWQRQDALCSFGEI
jgi:hypothetical protein